MDQSNAVFVDEIMLSEEDRDQVAVVLRQLADAEARLMVCHRAMEHIVDEIGEKLGLDGEEWGFDQDKLWFVRLKKAVPE